MTKPIMHGCEIPCEHIFEAKGFLISDRAVSRNITGAAFN